MYHLGHKYPPGASNCIEYVHICTLSYITVERNAKISATQRRKVGKLTPEIVAEIRASDATLKELSEKYGIAKSTVGDIRRFEGWKDYSSPFMGLMR